MQREEARDTGALLGAALGEVSELVRDVHRAVAGRMFDLLGPRAIPVRLIHDGVCALAYSATRLGVRTLPAVVGATTAGLRRPSADSIHGSARGHLALNALNGFWGDRLVEQRASLAPTLSVRTHGGELRRLPANVIHDVGDDATGRVVVFVHGLCENDRFWWLGAQGKHGDPDVTYGSMLRREQGWTPLYVSYNSGLHISSNGRELSDRLEAILARWPVPVTEIAVVGHSMGGLVARSAAHQAAVLEHAWVTRLRHVVGLGAPHHGAPLERFVNAGTHVMGRLPETRPLATWLNRRSAGIKDLRYGSLLEDDWWGIDPDERLIDRRTESALLPGVRYSAVSATLSRRPDGRFAHDLLVQHSSAHGVHPTRGITVEDDRRLHLGGRTHFDLLNDPLIHRQLRVWLAD